MKLAGVAALDDGGAGGAPLLISWPRPLMVQVVNGEAVVAIEHLQAGAALVGDFLRVLGPQAQRDAATP